MSALVLRFKGSIVLANVAKDGKMTVYVDGHEMPQKSFDASNPDSLIEADPFFPELGYEGIVHLHEALLQFPDANCFAYKKG
ncbi:hypothetical protein WJX72_007287 [[Myrmecia] bisecta]|uniref:Uncharacterized protein n=1 Tax=[Myrmecia] bisecta TaxID=41462 RepID=A0AAW1R7A2_9CHLO